MRNTGRDAPFSMRLRWRAAAASCCLLGLAGCTENGGRREPETVAARSPAPVGADIDWPMTRGGPALDGRVAAPVPRNPGIQWTVTLPDAILAEVAILGGRVYAGTDGGTLYCLSGDAGAEIWRFETGHAVSAAPAVTETVVFVSSTDGSLYAVDAEDGREIWRFETTDKVSAGAVLARNPAGGEWVLINGYDGTTRALDAATGALAWSYATEDFINGSPAVVDGRFVVFGGCDSQLHVINLADGSFVHAIPTSGQIPASIATFGGMAYCGNYANEAVGFDVARGSVAWVYQDRQLPFFSSPAVNATHVFIGSRDKHLHAIERETGEGSWKFATGGRVEGSPIVFEDAVVFGSTDGRLYALEIASGAPVWTLDLGEDLYASAAFGRGRIIVGGEGGTVFAISEQPTAHKNPSQD